MSFFDEAMAWGMEQEEEAHEQYEEFVREQSEIWTPHSVFDKCCVKWLANGREIESHGYENYFEDNLNDGNVVGKGCDYCQEDHPEIRLLFDSQHQVTIAKLSHQLDPFVHCMEALVENGVATKEEDGVYHLKGYVRENGRKIVSTGSFGKHLVVCSKKDIKDSDNAKKAAMKKKEEN